MSKKSNESSMERKLSCGVIMETEETSNFSFNGLNNQPKQKVKIIPIKRPN